MDDDDDWGSIEDDGDEVNFLEDFDVDVVVEDASDGAAGAPDFLEDFDDCVDESVDDASDGAAGAPDFLEDFEDSVEPQPQPDQEVVLLFLNSSVNIFTIVFEFLFKEEHVCLIHL